MSPASVPSAEHAAEVSQQESIQQELVLAPAPVAEGDSVKLRSVNVDTYPLYVSVVGVEDELAFDSASATVSVSPEVAEQVKCLPTVEVAA
jgi:hypothetical protein